jgi:hydroxypyruvate reductase
LSERETLVALYRSALASVHAGRAVARALPALLPPDGAVRVLAAGKAACSMARAGRELLGARLRGGAVHTCAGHASAVDGLLVREAGHPLPDSRSVAAAEEALALAGSLAADETLLVLLSGGASALWCAPAAGLELEDKRAVTDALLRRGAAIAELNAVRKHLSRIKGGLLARAAGPGQVLSLAVSDVRGDRPDVIGSGPTVPDSTSFADALAVLERHALLASVPRSARTYLEGGAAGRQPETARAAELGATRYRVIASLGDALAAAASQARARGIALRELGASLYGDVGDLARELAQRVRESRDVLIVAGGEPEVRVRGPGRGGRCQELAARLALELEGEPGWLALCAGSDGTDGSSPAAGALVDPGSLGRARSAGLDVRECLARSDSFALLSASGDVLHTGPTETNVADLVLVRVRR